MNLFTDQATTTDGTRRNKIGQKQETHREKQEKFTKTQEKVVMLLIYLFSERMAGFELLSDQGLRLDGRKAGELRRIQTRLPIK